MSSLNWKFAKNHLPTVDQVIRLFSAIIVDNELHESFKVACAVRVPDGIGNPDPGREMRLFRNRFSEDDVIHFVVQYLPGGVMTTVVQWTLEALTNSQIIIKIEPFVKSWQVEYFLNPSINETFCNSNLIKNILFGFQYIVENYRQSVYKVEISKDGDTCLGCAFLIEPKFKGKPVSLLVTNKQTCS